VTSKRKKKAKRKRDQLEGSQDEDGLEPAPEQPDANGVEQDDGEEWDGTDEMRKRKLDEYMEELYKLEFNDIVRLSLVIVVAFY